MKDKQLNKEEQMFNDKLNELEFEYNAADWNAIQDRLPKGGNSSLISGKGLIGIAAVAVVLVGSIYYVNNSTTPDNLTKDQSIPLQSNQIEKVDSKIEEQANSEVAESDYKQNIGSSNKTDTPVELQEIEETSKLADQSPLEKTKSVSNDQEPFEPKKSNETPVLQKELAKPTQNEVSYELIDLSVPDKICPNSTFIVEILSNTNLPKNWTTDWLVDGKVITKGGTIEGFELKENGMKKITVQVRNEKGEVIANKERAIELVDLSNYHLDFAYEDQTDPYNDLMVDLKAEGAGFDSFIWKEENGSQLGEGKNFSYNFKDKGVYDIELIALTNEGCELRSSKPVAVQNDFDPLAPNAFTPDNDGTNDVFIPVGFMNRDDRFKLEIFNLNGELIYKGTDNKEGWNGQLNNSGQMMPDGFYVWKVSISNDKGQHKSFAGNVQLMRNN